MMSLWCCHDGGDRSEIRGAPWLECVGVDSKQRADPVERVIGYRSGYAAERSRRGSACCRRRDAARRESAAMLVSSASEMAAAVVADTADGDAGSAAARAYAVGSIPVQPEFVQLMASWSPGNDPSSTSGQIGLRIEFVDFAVLTSDAGIAQLLGRRLHWPLNMSCGAHRNTGALNARPFGVTSDTPVVEEQASATSQ